jgi:hypothetical protein
MKLHPGRLLAGSLLVLALAAPCAQATPVTVRIVGESQRLGPVVVETPSAEVSPGCPGDSAAGAIDVATSGNWDKSAYASEILGESHTYTANDYWAFWVNGSYSQVGICSYTPSAGDELLLYVQRDDASFQGTVFPLYFSSFPSFGVVGQPVVVTVREHRSDGTTTTPTPVAGVTVTDGGAHTAVTDADGRATLSYDSAGTTYLVATKGGSVPSPVRALSVIAPVMAAPAPAAPVEPTPVEAAPAPPAAAPAPVAAPDTTAPVAKLLGIADGRRYQRSRAPRELRGAIAETGDVKQVKLRLTRRSGGRCATFSAGRERFRPIRCAGDGAWFGIGEDPQWSYLLPARLAPGRYELEVKATDAAGNTGKVERVRFRVS